MKNLDNDNQIYTMNRYTRNYKWKQVSTTGSQVLAAYVQSLLVHVEQCKNCTSKKHLTAYYLAIKKPNFRIGHKGTSYGILYANKYTRHDQYEAGFIN